MRLVSERNPFESRALTGAALLAMAHSPGGVLEYWSTGVMGPNTPVLQYSNTPIRRVSKIVGNEQQYTVQKGDSLLSIARRFNTDPGTLARLNRVSELKTGKTLRIPSLHILPARLEEGIVLNIPERALYVFLEGRLVGRYPVAVGMKGWPTPTGRYEILSMVEDPIWVTPLEMVKRKRIKPAALTADRKSPLGDRWMGWCEMKESDSAVGFHGTSDVNSIGKLASHACVRLYPEHARRMFEQVYEGMPVLSLYEPVKVGLKDGFIYLSVSPDIYARGSVSLAAVKQKLKAAGITRFDSAKVRSILARRDGYPYPIARVTIPKS